MNDRLKSESLTMLFNAFQTLENHDEYLRFFTDLCTVTEIQSLAQRFEVAMLLIQGQRYQDITEKTGASAATISRVARSLEYGADGYKLALERLNGR